MADTASSANALTFPFDSHAVRAVLRDGEPWFVAADVCGALDVQNVTQAVARLDSDERAMFNIHPQGNTNIINESGLYSLILGSRKPEAKRFKKWVTSEVLPAIRRTGAYGPADRHQSAASPATQALIDLARAGALSEARVFELAKMLVAPQAAPAATKPTRQDPRILELPGGYCHPAKLAAERGITEGGINGLLTKRGLQGTDADGRRKPSPEGARFARVRRGAIYWLRDALI